MDKKKGGCDCGEGGAPSVDPADLARHQAENAGKYKAHFMDPPAEFKRVKAEVFQIERSIIEKRPPLFLCAIRGGYTRFEPQKKLDVTIYEASDYVHRVTPKDLPHLKALAGVPNEVHQAAPERGGGGCGPRQYPVEMVHVPADAIRYNRLSAEQRRAVHHLSLNLLLGQVDLKRAATPPYKAVVDAMLERASNLPTFVGKDLLVCPNETVEFAGFGAVHFDNVVVLGNGRILLGPGTKLHAYQIKHA